MSGKFPYATVSIASANSGSKFLIAGKIDVLEMYKEKFLPTTRSRRLLKKKN
jgi:hypothetical protein